MPEAIMLIDHDNAPFGRTPLSEVLRGWLGSLAGDALPAVCDATVRAYGGWWFGDLSSSSRYKAVGFYTTQCPAITEVNGRYWRIRFEFADHLYHPLRNGMSPRIENTFVLRPAPQLFSRNDIAGCDEADCEMAKIQRWVQKRRGCTRAACSKRFGDMWYKPEQKQVDTHLTLDLIALASTETPKHVAVVSDDIDFLPSLLVATSLMGPPGSVTQVRFSERRTYLDEALLAAGLHLLEYSGDT